MPTSLDTYAPFDSGAGSNVTEATWRKFMRHMLGSASGVIRGFTNEFAVTGDGSGMNVKVATGECWIRGHYGESTSIKTLTIAAAHATLARKDRVILRADFTNDRVEVDVLTGTAAASPITPAVTQSTTIWETSLAIVDVPAADTSIASTQVTDDRVFTSAHAKYVRHNTAPVQSVATNAFTKMTFTEISSRSGDVTHNAAADEFTLNRAGLWTVTGRVSFSVHANGNRDLRIVDSGDTSLIYGWQTTGGGTGGGGTLSCTSTDRFPVGKRLSLLGWQNSGATLDVKPSDITFTWVGP